jgi:hypothetical protein
MGSEPEVRVSFGGEIIFDELPLGNLCGHSDADPFHMSLDDLEVSINDWHRTIEGMVK